MPFDYRVDAGGAVQSRLDANGFLRVDGIAAKVGIYAYRKDDGSIVHELVTEECLRDAAANAMLAGAPVTVGHPSAGLLTPANAKKHTTGSVSATPKFDNGELFVEAVITDAAAIKAIDSNRTRQLSPGYKVELDVTPGEWNGQRYDAKQVKRYYNHLALVTSARGGSDCKLNLDGFYVDDSLTAEEGRNMPTVKLPNGVEVEVQDPSAASAIQTAFNSVKNDSTDREKLEKELADAKAKVDALQGQIDQMESESTKKEKEAESKTDAAIDARLLTIDSARLLKADIDLRKDGKLKSARDLMEEALGEKFDGKSDEYVTARFDQAVSTAEKEGRKTNLGNQRKHQERKDGDDKLAKSPQAAYREKFYGGKA